MTTSLLSHVEQLLIAAQAGNEVALGALLEHFRNYLELLARLELAVVCKQRSIRPI